LRSPAMVLADGISGPAENCGVVHAESLHD
jgi:hypothetical protein